MAASAVALKLPTFGLQSPPCGSVKRSSGQREKDYQGRHKARTSHHTSVTTWTQGFGLLISPLRRVVRSSQEAALTERTLSQTTTEPQNPRFGTTRGRPSIRPHGCHARTHPGWRTTRIPLQGDFPSSTPTRDPPPH
ncbi:Hypothetical protein FKW44_010800 [Caligus rogercresseyi]|uniref:Uncharacterized protein n=1 Tax=Caligus rogercresseyi TaxID=217165 RepID=A0A7T8HH42_CALRO|nr:Hypothetical protein FKW44_010800 [Caligus rogercresseyi]